MIKNTKMVRKFERDLARREKLSFGEALRIFDALWREALSLKVIKRVDALEGIEKEIRMARIINGL